MSNWVIVNRCTVGTLTDNLCLLVGGQGKEDLCGTNGLGDHVVGYTVVRDWEPY